MPNHVQVLFDRASFPGPRAGVETFRGAFVGQSIFNGCVILSSWPRGDAKKLLPPDVDLAVNRSAAPDRHPLVFLFGDQTEGATKFAGLTLPTGIRYQEFALAVPFVRCAGGAKLHTYMVRMVSTHRAATLAGNLYYGFGKRMGRMGWEGPVFLMTDELGRLLFHAEVEATEEWRACGAGAAAQLSGLRTAFSLPILGLRGGGFTASYFAWDFEDARARSVDAALSIDRPFADGLASGALHSLAPGSVELRGMRWRLSWPAPVRP